MSDQANQLRQLARLQVPAAPPDRAGPRLLAVSGGKGGVGATTVAMNLAATLARRAYRTGLVDADPQGDAAVRCRLQERYTLADVLSGRRTVREALVRGPAGMLVLPGVWESEQVLESSASAQDRLVQQLQGIADQVDCLVVDTGDGRGRLVRRIWQAADLALVVTTPELDSLMAAYNSIKTLSAGLDQLPIATLVTMAANATMAEDTHLRLARACLRFLGIRLQSAGYLASDAEVLLATGMNELFSVTSPNGAAARQLGRLADTLAADVKLERAGGGK